MLPISRRREDSLAGNAIFRCWMSTANFPWTHCCTSTASDAHAWSRCTPRCSPSPEGWWSRWSCTAPSRQPRCPTSPSRCASPNAFVLGLCSLGSALEARVAGLFPDEPAQAVVLDEIGNAMVAGLARRLHRQIRDGCGRGAARRARLSARDRPLAGRASAAHLPPARGRAAWHSPHRRIDDGAAEVGEHDRSGGQRLGRTVYAPASNDL